MQNHTQTHNDLKDDAIGRLYFFEPSKGAMTVGDLRVYLQELDDDTELVIRMVDQRRFVKKALPEKGVILGSVGY